MRNTTWSVPSGVGFLGSTGQSPRETDRFEPLGPPQTDHGAGRRGRSDEAVHGPGARAPLSAVVAPDSRTPRVVGSAETL